MKRIKTLFVLVSMLLLSGCSAEYNLNIQDDIYSESIKVTLNDLDDSSFIENFDSTEQYISNTPTTELIYFKEKDDDGENSIYTFTHDFSFDEFRGSLSNKCFDNLKLEEDAGIYSLTAYGFNCLNDHQIYADTYKINIKTNYKVINNNADEVKGNIYTWFIDQKDNKNKNIIFQYSKIKSEIPTENSILPMIIPIIISIIILISVIIFNSYKNNNRGE